MNANEPKPPVIGSLGELLVEFVCLEQDGHNVRAAPYVGPFASGAPGIFIDQAARMGATTIFSGAVGDDAFGQVLRNRLESVDVANTLIRTIKGVPTGSAFVSYNKDGSRDFVFNIAHSAAAHFPTGQEAIAALLAAGITVFHISGSTLGNPAMCAAALEICTALHAADVEISFDPNVRKELLGDPVYLAAVRQLTGIATYFLPSDDDAAVLFPGESFEDFSTKLIASGVKYVVLKRGAIGSTGRNADGTILSVTAHKVDVLDPTGAGDCFCATFVASIVSGADFARALHLANAAGALAVGKVGPMEGNSTLADIKRFLEAQP
ncbi:sugar kinase [Devosia sp. 2618]|uniref:sugar kinase n=1 Tax=Devosia sp. 2618 TaxID=3156454 RepID=UPI003394F7DB